MATPLPHTSQTHDSSPPATSFEPKRFYQHQQLTIAPTYRIAARTDVGIRRKSNQDAFTILSVPLGFLGVVCDGMGGYQGGDIASKLAIEAITRTVETARHKVRWQPRSVLREAIQAANLAIHSASKTQEKLKQMGSTVVAVLVIEDQAYVAHVGDSRLYLLREQSLLQVTRDHSAIERMKQQGQSTENAKTNLITRVLGRLPEVDVESPASPIALQHGDRLLLCSDGLTAMLSNQDILHALSHLSDPVLAAERMVESANHNGGKDNTTLLIADYTKPQTSFAWGFAFWILLLAVLLFWPTASTTLPQLPPAPSIQTRSLPLPPPRYAVPSVLISPPRQTSPTLRKPRYQRRKKPDRRRKIHRKRSPRPRTRRKPRYHRRKTRNRRR